MSSSKHAAGAKLGAQVLRVGNILAADLKGLRRLGAYLGIRGARSMQRAVLMNLVVAKLLDQETE